MDIVRDRNPLHNSLLREEERHIFFEISGHDQTFWTDILKMPENLFIIVPFIYFGLSVVMAYLIKRFILDKLKKNNSID